MAPRNSGLRKLRNTIKVQQDTSILEYFKGRFEVLPDVPDWFQNAVFITFDLQCYSQKKLPSGTPKQITEIGFSVIYGQKIIDTATSEWVDFECLIEKMVTCHLRIKETCHMVNREIWMNDKAEENFLFGQTGFVTEEEAKEFTKAMLTESTWQTGQERRPIIILGQGIWNKFKVLKKRWGINFLAMDIVKVMQASQLAQHYNITNSPVGLTQMMEGFGINPVKDFYQHNAGNDAALIMIIGLAAGLNDLLHPGFSRSGGWPRSRILGVEIADIVKSVASATKADPAIEWDVSAFCSRCESNGHLIGECSVQGIQCDICGSNQHIGGRCIAFILREQEKGVGRVITDKFSSAGELLSALDNSSYSESESSE